MEIDGSIHGGDIALPDGTVLPPVVELYEQCAGPEGEFFGIVIDVFFLIPHPFLNIWLVVPIEFQAIRKHFETNDVMWFVGCLALSKEFHPCDD